MPIKFFFVFLDSTMVRLEFIEWWVMAVEIYISTTSAVWLPNIEYEGTGVLFASGSGEKGYGESTSSGVLKKL